MRDINDICLAAADIYLENDDMSYWWWYGLSPLLLHSDQISCLVGFWPPEWNVVTGCGRFDWQRRLIRCMTRVPRLALNALCYYNWAIARVRDEIEGYFSRLYKLWLTNEDEIPPPPSSSPSPTPTPPPSPPDDPQRTSVFNPNAYPCTTYWNNLYTQQHNFYLDNLPILGWGSYYKGNALKLELLTE